MGQVAIFIPNPCTIKRNGFSAACNMKFIIMFWESKSRDFIIAT